MTFNPGDKYYFKGYAAPHQVYTIERVDLRLNRLYTTESSGGMNNEMNKWYNITDFVNYINLGLIVRV